MAIHELAVLTVQELTAGFSTGRISPVEVLNATLDHCDKVNPVINALFSIRSDEALESARASEARYRLGRPLYHGIGANRDASPSSYDSPPAARPRTAALLHLNRARGGFLICLRTTCDLPDRWGARWRT